MTRNTHQHGWMSRLARRCTAVTAAATLTLLLARWGSAAWVDLRALPDSPTATSADAIADLAAVVALTAWAWLLLGAVITVVEILLRPSGRRLAPHIAPAAWRRLVISLVGVGLLSAPAGIAQASPGDPAGVTGALFGPDQGSPSTSMPAQAVRGLPLPDRPFSRFPVQSPPMAGRDAASASKAPQRVTVRPGDSLWAIAERHLGPRAGDRVIADEWRRWYAANRARIGPNPDLIHPGTVLHSPTRKAAS